MSRRVTRVWSAVLATLVSALAGSSAMAGVKLAKQGPELRVEVELTTRGPWSPVGAVEPMHLNPTGDLSGDGSPVISRLGAHPVVAWYRPVERALRVATARPSGWRDVARIETGEVLGKPMFVSGDSSTLLVWQERSHRAEPSLLLAELTPGAVGAVSLADGYLLSAGAFGDAAGLLVAEPRADGDFELVLHSVITPIDRPIDWGRFELGEPITMAQLTTLETLWVQPVGAETPVLAISWQVDTDTQRHVLMDEQGVLAAPTDAERELTSSSAGWLLPAALQPLTGHGASHGAPCPESQLPGMPQPVEGLGARALLSPPGLLGSSVLFTGDLGCGSILAWRDEAGRVGYVALFGETGVSTPRFLPAPGRQPLRVVLRRAGLLD